MRIRCGFFVCLSFFVHIAKCHENELDTCVLALFLPGLLTLSAFLFWSSSCTDVAAVSLRLSVSVILALYCSSVSLLLSAPKIDSLRAERLFFFLNPSYCINQHSMKTLAASRLNLVNCTAIVNVLTCLMMSFPFAFLSRVLPV